MQQKDFRNKDTQIRYVNQDKLSQHLLCSVCQDVFSDPVFINCGHVFCKNCIIQWSNQRNQCPVCRQLFTKNSLTPCFLARSLIGELEIFCINPGCRWQGILTDLQAHLKQCKYDPRSLPEWLAQSFKNWDGSNGNKGPQSFTTKYIKNKLQDQVQQGLKPNKQILDLDKDINKIARMDQQKRQIAKKKDELFIQQFSNENLDLQIEQSKKLLEKLREYSPSPFSSPRQNAIKAKDDYDYVADFQKSLKEKDEEYELYLKSLSQNAIGSKPAKKKKNLKKKDTKMDQAAMTSSLNSKFKCDLSSPSGFRQFI